MATVSTPLGKSPYITAAGYLRLQEEERLIWKRRREVTVALTAAAAEGDRSENAEYIYRKKELREIDRRIRYLQKRLPELKVVTSKPSDKERVFFGAWVALEDEAQQLVNYRIVGPDEFDAHPDYISMDSPMARALFKHTFDDKIEVQAPQSRLHYVIRDIRYQD